MRRWLQLLQIPCGYMLLTILLTFPMITRMGTSLNSWGDPQLQAWILAWDAHALQTHPGSIWDAPIFYPYPDTLAYTDHHLLVSLLSAPIIWLTHNPVLAYNILVLLSFVLSAWAMYGLINQLIGQRGIALLAGILFAFAPFRMAQIFHLQLLQTAWMVWALMFAHRLLIGRQTIDSDGQPVRINGHRADAIWLGVFVGIQSIAALYYAFFVLVAVGGFIGWWLLAHLIKRVRYATPLPWSILGNIAISVIIALVIAVPLTMPYLRVYQTLGIVRSIAELNNWSAPLASYLTVTDNTLWSRFGMSVNSGEWVLFPGVLVTLLAVYALWKPRRELWFWLVLATVAFGLSLGTGLRFNRGDPVALPLPLYTYLYSYLPGFGALRVPSRWGLLVTLAFVVLAAYGLRRLLEHRSPRWRMIMLAGMTLFALLDLTTIPLRTTNPEALQTVAPVYAWLGEPAQNDLHVVLELPQGATPRGDELQRMTWRMFDSRYHWKQLPVAFSGLIPFGTTDLLAEIQHLPNDETLRYLQIIGIDTLVIHRDEYKPEALQKLTQGLQASSLVAHRADVGDATVYTLQASSELAQIEAEIGDGSIFMSNDERLPGMLALGLVRRWQDQGRAVHGQQRVKYYGDLLPVERGQSYSLGVLPEGVDPRPFGFDAAGVRWQTNGLAMYVRNPALRANVDLAQRDLSQTHPTYPAKITLAIQADMIQVDTNSIRLNAPISQPILTLAIASLMPQNLQIGATTMPISAGVSLLNVPLALGNTVIQGDQAQTALLWLRVSDGAVNQTPLGGLAVQAQSTWQGSQLTIQGDAAGSGELLIDLWGAAADTDRPIHVLRQTYAPDHAFPIAIDLATPKPTWLQSSAWIDGRYIVYLKFAATPEATGSPIASFVVRNGQLNEQRSVTLPLTALP